MVALLKILDLGSLGGLDITSSSGESTPSANAGMLAGIILEYFMGEREKHEMEK